jgi:hypothetical protein
MVPLLVKLWVRVALGLPLVTALPVNTGAATVPVAVVTGDTPVLAVLLVTRSGVALVLAAATGLPVNAGALLVPAAVTEWVWAAWSATA